MNRYDPFSKLIVLSWGQNYKSGECIF